MSRLGQLLTNRRPSDRGEGDTQPADPRPAMAIGHVSLTGEDLGRLARFYDSVGMRKVIRLPGFAILELRGGTHLVLSKGPVGVTTLDLMVDDIDDTHRVLAAAGAEPSAIGRSGPHRTCTATDPEGNTLVVNSSHVAGPV